MSIESDLRKDGIEVIEPLDRASINSIAKNVSEKIIEAFPNFGFTFNGLYERFSNLPMYIADIPEGMSEASYFYKNSSVYFRDGMGLADLEKFAVHELIHNLQEVKDSKGDLDKLGLCTFKNSRIHGMAMNEAAVQLLASNIENSTFETVTYYDITFSTISPNCYPLLCNLMYQMTYITGEEVLFDSAFNSNDHFKNKFISICGESAYSQLSNLFDKILGLEEKIINLNNRMQISDLSNSKTQSIYKKINDLKQQIRNSYLSAQEMIIKSYFSNALKTLTTSVDIDHFRKKLYSFQDLIGTAPNYSFFNSYYISMMESLDNRYDILSNASTSNTYLILKKESKFSKFVDYIKKILWNKQTQNTTNKTSL